MDHKTDTDSAADALIRKLRDILDESRSYIGAPTFSPSMDGEAAVAVDLADQYLAGRASLAASAGSEPVPGLRQSLEGVFRGLSDRAYCNYIEQMRRDVCLGWEHKAAHGKFGEAELKGHTRAGEMLGRHKAFAEAANALRGSDAPLTHPSPPEGAGWRPIETAPKDGTPILVSWPVVALDEDFNHTDQVVDRSTLVTFWRAGYWMDADLCNACGSSFDDDHEFAEQPDLWRPLPAPPASEAKEASNA